MSTNTSRLDGFEVKDKCSGSPTKERPGDVKEGQWIICGYTCGIER